MAKRVTFSKKPKKSGGGGDTSFDLGHNVMSKLAKKSYRQKHRSGGHSAGGGS